MLFRSALFEAPDLQAAHLGGEGPADWFTRGRQRGQHVLEMAATAGGGAGTWLLVAIELAGQAALYAAWSVRVHHRRNRRFAAGLVAELARLARQAARRALCG